VNTFTTSAGTIQDGNTPLTPFHDGETAFWTSNNVRATQVFGYEYAETVNSAGTNTRQNVITAINTLYGNSNTNQRRDLSQNHTHYEWLANIKVKKHALNAPFFIHAFIGPFDPNPFSWSFEPNLVASHCVFLKASNVSAVDDVFVSAAIPLTTALQDNIVKGALKSLDPADVTDFLGKNFQYRLTTMDDKEVGNDQVPSLTISLVSAPVQLPGSVDELPVWGNTTSWADISTNSRDN
jgi:tyrosinase